MRVVEFFSVLCLPSLVTCFTSPLIIIKTDGTTCSRSKLCSIDIQDSESSPSSRRNFVGWGMAVAANVLAVSVPAADAFTHETYFLQDSYIPTSQLAPTGKLDVNSAFGESRVLI